MAGKGIILTLIPNVDYTSRRPGIVNPHLTVLYFGTVESVDFNRQALGEYWEMMGKVWGHQIKANVTAESAFDGGEDGFAMVDLINAPFLPDFYGVASEAAQVCGLEQDHTFGLLPHITRRYLKGQSAVEIVHRKLFLPFSFDQVGLWIGDERLGRSLT